MPYSQQNLEKAAAILTCLGEPVMREVLAVLPPPQLQAISAGLTQIRPITPGERETLLNEFYRRYIHNIHTVHITQDAHPSGEKNLRDPEQQAPSSARVKAPKPFERLHDVEPLRLLDILAHEPPSIITLLLYYLPRPTAAQILAGLTAETRHEVVMRLVNLRMPTPQVVSRLEQLILEKLADGSADVENAERDLGAVFGARTLVEVLGRTNPTVERQVYEFLQERDPQLAEEVRKQMFIFEDLIRIEPRMLQIVLREITAQDLAVAMKGASSELRELILKNVSENFAKTIREEIDLLGPVRVIMVEEAQQKITGVVRRLSDEGVITVNGGEQDEEFI